ncbi:pre T-cell antigen receptor alpha [Equus asinus]|uniref:pre T-cell antigen receptor alpha n=1 Tax=Equus asinus TaxID=9793 RepID=UPI0038F77CD0
MARTWLLLLLALGCPALPTDVGRLPKHGMPSGAKSEPGIRTSEPWAAEAERANLTAGHWASPVYPISFPSSPDVTTLLRLARQGVRGTPFPSLAPPITLLVDGKQQTLVVCLVLDAAPPGLESSIWFSAGNGSALDAFTYGPSLAEDGTWTSLAQLSLPSEELAAWETLVCHTGPGAGDHSRSTQPLQLSGEASSARICLREPLRGTRGQTLRLGALRLLLFKLLLFDLLLTCSRLRALPAARGYPARAPGPRDPATHEPPAAPRADRPFLPQPLPVGEPSAPAHWLRRRDGGTTGRALTPSTPPALQPRAGREVPTLRPRPDPRSPVWEEGMVSANRAWA